MKGRKPVVPPLGDVVDLPSSSVRVPPCPDYLQGRQRDVWGETAAVMVGKNIYDEDCKQMLAAYCVQFARFLDAEDEIRVTGVLAVSPTGRDIAAGWVLTSNNAYDKMVRLASELGLTPVSRKRVVKVRGSSSAPATRFLKRA